jgi:hypothetical protein
MTSPLDAEIRSTHERPLETRRRIDAGRPPANCPVPPKPPRR